MTIRDAVIADVPRLVEMGQRFLATSPYRGQIAENPAQFGIVATRCITDPDGTMLVAEMGGIVVGMIALFVFAHPLSAQRTAGELCWWVEPEARGAGVRLMKAAEVWARAHGAETLQMIAPMESDEAKPPVATVYERAGYRLAELAYVKVLR